MDYVLYDASTVLPGHVAQLVVRRGYEFDPGLVPYFRGG